jgi:hypothetical protein
MSMKKQRDKEDWALIRESLDAFRPAQLAALLREYLAPRLPPGTTRLDEQTRHTLFQGVSALLAEHAGAWYTKADVQLGHEALGGYDWRLGFFPDQGSAPDLGVESNVQRILAVLGMAHEWLCTLDTYFRSLVLPRDEEDRATVLSDAVRRVLELTLEATCGEDDWVHHAHLALGWLLESLGLRRNERRERALRMALADFKSGTIPSTDEARQAADTIALAVVKVDLARRYPDEEAS